MDFIEIESITEFDYDGVVYDLAVEDDASYNIGSIVVHNSACTTSANAAIHYPMGSLIRECYEMHSALSTPAKIVADGGFKKYSDIIKALALGADYVMIGGILSKAIDSCSDKYCVREYIQGETKEIVNQEAAERHFKNGEPIYSLYRGMSTKAVQSKWGKTSLKTAEGISKFNIVEYTTAGWTENLVDYLKSNMSYCGKRSLVEYCGQVQYVQITQHAKERFTK